MLTFLFNAWNFVEEHFAWFLVLGCVSISFYHLRLWKRDRQRIAKLEWERREIDPADNLPLVSILVPAWNEVNDFEACICSILALRYPKKELILCAGGQDGTYDKAKTFISPSVVVLEQMPGEGKQRALQRCFEASIGQIIFLTDADCIIEDRVFESTLNPILREGIDVTTGTWRPFNSSIKNFLVQFQWSHHLYREAWLPDSPATFDGRNAAIRRKVIEIAKPFLDDAPTGTDYVQSKKITLCGFKIHLVRGSRVQTEYPETVKAYWKQLSRWFRTPLLLGKRWGDKALARSMFRSSIYAMILLFSIPFLFIRIWLIAWLIMVIHLVFTQVRVSDIARKYQDTTNHPKVKFCCLQRYLPIGWIGLLHGLFDSLLLNRRRRW